MLYVTTYESEYIDLITIGSDGENIIGLWIGKKHYLKNNINQIVERKDNLKVFIIVKKWLDKYFKGDNPSIDDIPINLKGTEFQKIVWDILLEIQYGATTTYIEIGKKVAKRLGKEKMSSQAIGAAVGKNPILIIIPCHRVISTKGELRGYSAGIEYKENLLKLEKIYLK